MMKQLWRLARWLMKKGIVETGLTREQFAAILREYDYSDKQIEMIWNTRPAELDNEAKLRRTAESIAPRKDRLVQA